MDLRALAWVSSIAMIAIVACGPAAAPTPGPAIPVPTPRSENTGVPGVPKEAAAKETDAAKPPSKDAQSMARFEALVQAAKKEGKIVVSNNQSFVRDALKESFGKKFGIDVEYLHLGPTDLFNRLRTERQAGQYNLDIVLTGPGTFVANMIPEGMLDRLNEVLILPEVTDASKWLDGKIPWSDPEHRVLRPNLYVLNTISINTSIVKKGEIKAHTDLLDPKWKGKIAAGDPTVMGSGGVIGAFLFLTFGEDFVKQLYLGQEVAFSRDDRQMGDWLAHGKYPVLIWGSEAIMADMKRDGLPVEVVVTEDAAPVDAGSGALGMLNRAPHPNAAKLFVNWFASKEGQEMWVKTYQRPITRVDVDQSALPDYLKTKPGVRYLDAAGYDYLVNQRLRAQERLREIIKR